MQHDPTASLLAQGTGKIVAMSGGGSGGASAFSSSSSAPSPAISATLQNALEVPLLEVYLLQLLAQSLP